MALPNGLKMVNYGPTSSFPFVLGLFSSLLLFKISLATEISSVAEKVLNEKVKYSPLPESPKYTSDATFNPRGMEHVYFLANTFLDLIQRDNVLPPSINASDVNAVVEKSADRKSAEPIMQFLKEHWQDILLQYIGILTTAGCGILMALVIPFIGFLFCCCRCCGKCGAYPDTHYDKRSDACKRISLGILVSVFVMATVFGAVCAFVTNFYTYQGAQQFTTKLDNSLDDAGKYLEHTGTSVNTLLVVNYNELEGLLGEVLDESGIILKNSLAKVTQAIAINNLTDIVAGLGAIRINLKDILDATSSLEQNVSDLRTGLRESQTKLTLALVDCNSDTRCRDFLKEYNLQEDLSLAEDFLSVEFKMPDLASTLRGVKDLINNNIENKVLAGKKEFDLIEEKIEDSIDAIKPKVKQEIRTLGEELEQQNTRIQEALRRVDIGSLQKDVPLIDDHSQQYIEWRYYVGLGLSSMVLLILACFVFGLFYGMCGQRPGGLYGDQCCNKGTGANCLLTGILLTFLFTLPLMLGTTAHFLLGASLEKVVCESLQRPESSDLFSQVDQVYIRPVLTQALGREDQNYTAGELMKRCHANQTVFNVLNLEKVYNLSELLDWRTNYGIKEFIENLKNKVRLDQLSDIRLLSPETIRDLESLANSKISDMDFSRFTNLLEDQITKIDLRSLIPKLRQLKEIWRGVDKNLSTQIELQARWLQGMNKIVADIKSTIRKLKSSVNSLQENSRFNHSSMREAVRALINQANSATDYLQREGPVLVTDLTAQFAGEMVGLIDNYAARVNHSINHQVGSCGPLSRSVNATVVALCNEIVDPFNGFWAALGWCYLLYLPILILSVSLISLYRKSEPYPGPLVESQPLDSAQERGESSKKTKKGHRRNPSAFLPEYTHSRPPPQQQQQPPFNDARYRDIAPRNFSCDDGGAPPRYSSNPALPNAPQGGEYERPPPYYYPGPPPQQ